MQKEHTMPKWNLMRLATAADGARSLAPLTKEQELLAPWYETLLARASEANCGSPVFSGYHVKGCIAAGELTFAHGGNIEYGHYQALHLEEAAVAALASRQNSVDNLATPVLAIVAGEGPGTINNFTMPCGNCRDILRDTVGEGCVLLLGTRGGGAGVVATLADALFTNYARVPLDRIDVLDIAVTQTIREGARLAKNFHYDPLKCPSRNYAAALTTGEGRVGDRTYFGATSVGDDYHPLYPCEMAVLRAEMDQNPYITSVIIVAEGDDTTPPDVLYRDRQRLLELAIDREFLTGVKCNPVVRLFTHTKGSIAGAWKTSVDEWLPMPFSRRNFRKSKTLAEYTKKLRKKYNR